MKATTPCTYQDLVCRKSLMNHPLPPSNRNCFPKPQHSPASGFSEMSMELRRVLFGCGRVLKSSRSARGTNRPCRRPSSHSGVRQPELQHVNVAPRLKVANTSPYTGTKPLCPIFFSRLKDMRRFLSRMRIPNSG